MESTTWHYPPDFLEMMVGTIALLVKSKTGLCSFFEGAGVPVAVLRPLRERIASDREPVRMVEIARTAIEAANKMSVRTFEGRFWRMMADRRNSRPEGEE